MIFEKIKKVIVEQLGVEESEVTLGTSFEELGVDSLDLFQIIIEFEDEFGIQIENPEDLKTIEDAVKYVQGKIEE